MTLQLFLKAWRMMSLWALYTKSVESSKVTVKSKDTDKSDSRSSKVKVKSKDTDKSDSRVIKNNDQ